jgi:hypothetical protein
MSVMVAQFIEEHFYGGVGNYVKRKERVYVDPVVDPENDDESSEGVSIASSMKEEMMKRGVWKERKRLKVRVCVCVCFMFVVFVVSFVPSRAAMFVSVGGGHARRLQCTR